MTDEINYMLNDLKFLNSFHTTPPLGMRPQVGTTMLYKEILYYKKKYFNQIAGKRNFIWLLEAYPLIPFLTKCKKHSMVETRKPCKRYRDIKKGPKLAN
jgi:hypothetical protein